MRPGVVQSRCSQWRMTRSSPVSARGMRPRGDAMVHGTSRASPTKKKRCAALVRARCCPLAGEHSGCTSAGLLTLCPSSPIKARRLWQNAPLRKKDSQALGASPISKPPEEPPNLRPRHAPRAEHEAGAAMGLLIHRPMGSVATFDGGSSWRPTPGWATA